MAGRAIVMNMFYTGLGIARSLGERGVPVIGLTAHRGVYGNWTRYAKTVRAPDSRKEPDALLEFMLGLGRKLDGRSVVFPTRDDDLVFLDRFRTELEPFFSIVAPQRFALNACLNKQTTGLLAQEANVPAPKCWAIAGPEELRRIAGEVTYPCVLKPLAAYHWRQEDNWELVGARKAISISTQRELLSEYEIIARADERALVQEMVVGPDDGLMIVACYLDQESRWVAGLQLQKILQIPEGFGTGCIVQSTSSSDLFGPTMRLLRTMRFTGIAEVEYKRDAASGEYKLIEINARPWDQHRLGNAAGVDLIYAAYCDHSGLPVPRPCQPTPGHKWIAEDGLFAAVLHAARRGKPKVRSLLRLIRGKRIYAIWSLRDPLPSLAYWIAFIPELLYAGYRAVTSAFRAALFGRVTLTKERVRL